MDFYRLDFLCQSPTKIQMKKVKVIIFIALHNDNSSRDTIID